MPYLTLRLPVSVFFRGRHFPLFFHLVCGLLPTEHTAVFFWRATYFFCSFLCVLTVQIVVFEGGPPFGRAAIAHRRLDTATAAGEIFTATGDGAATASGRSEKKQTRPRRACSFNSNPFLKRRRAGCWGGTPGKVSLLTHLSPIHDAYRKGAQQCRVERKVAQRPSFHTSRGFRDIRADRRFATALFLRRPRKGAREEFRGRSVSSPLIAWKRM